MSTSSLGQRRVTDVIDSFVKLGFIWMKSSNSGQAISDSRSPWHIAGDVIFCREDILIQCEVGGVGKRLAVTFAEMRQSLLPCAHMLIVRFVKGKRRYHVSEDFWFSDLEAAIQHMKDD